jgi:hypothetical protein
VVVSHKPYQPVILTVIQVIEQWKEPYIRNSYLSAIKRALEGEPQWTGGEAFNKFGIELHKRYLQPDEPVVYMSDLEEKLMGEMLKKLRTDLRLRKIWHNCEREQDKFKVIDGVNCRITGDMLQMGQHGEDIKTTSCKSFREFELASKRYGYFRQAAFYMEVCDLKTFTFSGVKKHSPCSIYPLNVLDYPAWLKEGKEQFHYLLSVHKRYAGKKSKTIRA